MQQSTFFAVCPYEIGDKLVVGIKGNTLLVNCPKGELTAEVKITDIIAIHSIKRKTVRFAFEIFGGISGKLWNIADWKDAQDNE